MKLYYYLFYKLYKFSENSPSRWLSDWKAELAIDVLEIFIGLSILVYYTVITKKWIDFGNNMGLLFFYIAIIAFPNYLIFHHNNSWKTHVDEFDKWPRKKNVIGGIIVWSVIFLIIANMIFSFYLMSNIDWAQHR